MATPAGSASLPAPAPLLPRVLLAGLIAGVFDITDNIVMNHYRQISPAQIFRFIASGLVGPRAAAQSAFAVPLGVVMHFALAVFWVGLFYLLARRFAVLARRPVLGGLAYGAVVWMIMNWIALPLSRVPHRATPPLSIRIHGVLAVVICIGLAGSLLLRAFGVLRRPA